MSEHLAISAVLCTLDRGPDIEDTLRSMLDQTLPRARFEIVIVDNGSRPENRAILERIARAHAPTLRYVREDQRGLSHARNRGIAEARADLIAFVDDDARVTPAWLATYVEAFAAQPAVDVLGSSVELVHAVEPPPWAEDWMWPYLGAFDRGDRACELGVLDCPRGGNMVFRRRVFDAVGGFSPAFGRRPGSLISLEEVEICHRAVVAGFRLGYVPGAPLLHLVEAARWRDGWFRERMHWQGRSLAQLDALHFGRRRLLRKLPGQLRRAAVRRGLRRQLPWGYVVGALRSLLGRAP